MSYIALFMFLLAHASLLGYCRNAGSLYLKLSLVFYVLAGAIMIIDVTPLIMGMQ